MTTMVPAADPATRSLADVLPSCVAALRGESNLLGFGPAKQVVVLVVDGLGASALKQRSGYARTLAAATRPLFSGFPTTTAAALATLTTGAHPGQHGMVGYRVVDPARDVVVQQLSQWDAAVDPLTWQRLPTVFETAALDGIRSTVIASPQYAKTPLTRAILRGAAFRGAQSVEARFRAAADTLRDPAVSLTYLYVPELDMIGHKKGWQSDEWAAALELVDSELRGLVAGLRGDQAVIVTADHGVVDVDERKHVIVGGVPELMEGVRHVAGEPRCLQLHFDAGLTPSDRATVVGAWHESEDDRSWVVTRAEAIDAGWFGRVDPDVLPRIGDLLIAARKGIAYYVDADERGRGMVGQHGSWTPEETQVPLARFGAFA